MQMSIGKQPSTHGKALKYKVITLSINTVEKVRLNIFISNQGLIRSATFNKW